MFALLDAAERELAIRKAVYARKVAEGRMRPETADHQIVTQQMTADVLRELARTNETVEGFLHPEALQ